MLNNDKIRLMTKLALYEQKEGKKSLKVSKYYRSDYVSLGSINSAIVATLAYMMVLACIIFVNIENIFEVITVVDMFELGRIVIISYITYMLVYLVISYIVYRIKYDTKKVEIEKYDNNLKELFKIYKSDPEFTAEFIDAGIETVKHCFQCGTCGGGCPSGRRTPYKVRQIVRKCLLGLKEEVITDDALWMCTTCYTCQERCPRSVKIVEIIKKARNVAAHAGYMAKPHKMTGVFVINTGHAVPINDAAKALRTKIGLSEVPATTHADAGALEEVQKLCKITAFDELIGYDEATGGLKE